MTAQDSSIPDAQRAPLPPRPEAGHKGLFGRVLVIGGSDTMLGAPVLAGTAALRTGSGLVQIAVPASILPAALSVTPELIGLALNQKALSRTLQQAAESADVMIVGPGMGASPLAADRVRALWRLSRPAVFDADALNVLSRHGRWPDDFAARAVLTPHPGEMARLAPLFGQSAVPSDDAGRSQFAIQAARAFRQVIVLKGHRTIITDGDRIYINMTGNSSLSKAGAGDVLCGVLASLIGQGMPLFDAAVAAVHIHGRAGELAGETMGRRCVLARDVINSLPAAIAEYESEAHA